MSQSAPLSRRPMSSALRLQIMFACALSVVALSAILGGVRAQQVAPPSQGTQLPPVPVEPLVQAQPKQMPAPKQAAPAPQPKAAPVPKRVAAPKAQPKQAQAPVPVAAEPPASPANALGTYNPALDLRNVTLPPGTTVTTAGPVQGYRALSAMSSTKTATPIEQIPQSIQVVPRSAIDDQKNLTVSEAVQNVSNVQGPNARSLGDTQLYPYTIRGFGSQAWLDGMVMPFSLGDRDAFANVERIEVLKGPNAILYGGGGGAPIGGAVNIVSKLPFDRPSGEFGFTFGSHKFLQPYFDVNQPLSPNVLFRITGEYTATDSFIDILDQDRYSLNPTLTLTNKTDTTLTIQGRLSKSKQQTYQGLPATGTILGGFRLDRDLFIGPADIPRGFSEMKGITVTLDHRFNEIWSGNVKARWSHGSSQQFTQLAIGADPAGAIPAIPPSTWLLANSELSEDIQEVSVNPNLQGRFGWGPLKNTLLLGADYSRVKEKATLSADYLGNGCAAFFGVAPCFGLTGPTVDLLAPKFNVPFVDPRHVTQYQDFFGFDQVVNFGQTTNVYTTSGAYAQLQSTLYNRIHLLAGVRAAHVKIDQTEFALGFPQDTTTDAQKLLPRAGVLVDLMPGLSAYASYSEGMRAVARQLPGGKSVPEYSEQREIGLKFDVARQLTGTVAYFEIDRDNVVVNLGGLAGTALAKQKAQGYEADVLWQPHRHLQVLASYGYTDAGFADSLLGAPAGNKFPIVPQHSGRFWVNYKLDEVLPKGWSVGAGVYAASSQFIDVGNVYKVDGYYTVDAKLAYETEQFKAALHVKNLTGNEYFVPYAFLGGQVAPGDSRAVYGTVAYKY